MTKHKSKRKTKPKPKRKPLPIIARYKDAKGKFTRYLPNTMLTLEVSQGKKRLFSKRSYFEYDVRKEYKVPDVRIPFPIIFKPLYEYSFTLESKDRLWEKIPIVAMQRALQKANQDKIHIIIDAKVGKKMLHFRHEYIAPVLQLQVKGKKAVKLRENARHRLQQSIMDTLILDLTKSKYRMSSKSKIDKSERPEDIKAMRKRFPLLKKVTIRILYA